MIIKQEQKKINYFGLELVVPIDCNGFLTTDEDGSVRLSTGKVGISEMYNGWDLEYDFDDRQLFLCTVDLQGMDWKDTLMELEE